jgi:predicted metal-dependent hydrolase
MIPPEFWQGMDEFNQQEFYSCHDTLEAIWIEAEESDKRFYQGILQIAVACYHLTNLNWSGGVILLGEGLKRLNDYPEDYHHIDLDDLMTQAENLLEILQLNGQENLPTLITQGLTFPKIKKINP